MTLFAQDTNLSVNVYKKHRQASGLQLLNLTLHIEIATDSKLTTPIDQQLQESELSSSSILVWFNDILGVGSAP